jgi:NTE family protein
VRQQDLSVGLQLGASPNYRSRVMGEAAWFTNEDQYTNVQELTSDATLDETDF